MWSLILVGALLPSAITHIYINYVAVVTIGRDGTELPPPRGMVQSVNLHATVGPLIPQVYDENLTEFSSSGVVLCSNTRAALL